MPVDIYLSLRNKASPIRDTNTERGYSVKNNLQRVPCNNFIQRKHLYLIQHRSAGVRAQNNLQRGRSPKRSRFAANTQTTREALFSRSRPSDTIICNENVCSTLLRRKTPKPYITESECVPRKIICNALLRRKTPKPYITESEYVPRKIICNEHLAQSLFCSSTKGREV